MRVQLPPELFEPPVSHALLATFFHYALDGRHRIETDLAHPAVAQWLQEQSAGLRDEVRLAVDLSVEAEALQPSWTVVEIGRWPANDFQSRPIRLRLDEARAFLEIPVSLLLEDTISDRNFLFKMLTSEEQQALQTQFERGFVRIEHGGGLENMRRQIVERRHDPSIEHKLWLLFDSDALQPGRPSGPSEALRAACGPIPHYQLARRFMESYLPPKALHAWATRGHNAREQSRRFGALSAFTRMQPEQRHHYNMKAGFGGDRARTDASAGTLYDGVTAQDRQLLDEGFGTQVGTLFGGPEVMEADLRRDSGWSELRPVVQQLLAQLR